MNHENATQNEVWQVQVASGEIREVSLDTLDTLYEAGVIDESTFVLAPGAERWAMLGDVAGIDADSAPLAPAYSADRTMQLPASVGPISLRPVTAEVSELDLDFAPPSKSRWGTAAAAVGGVALLGAFVALALKFGSTSHPPVDTASASAPPPVLPAAEPAKPVAIETPAPDNRLTDDQKRALMNADKANAAKASAAKAEKSKKAAPAPRSRGKSKSGFIKGGDPHDPLNQSL